MHVSWGCSPYGATDAEVRLRAQLLVNVFMGVEPGLDHLPAEVADVDAASLPVDRGVDRFLLVTTAIFQRTMHGGSTQKLEDNLRRAVASMPAHSEALTDWDVRAALGAAMILADDALDEAYTILERVTPAVARLGGSEPVLQAELDHRRILDTMRRGDFEDALSRLDAAEDFTLRHGLTGYDGAHRFARGWIAMEKGAYAEAGALLAERISEDNVSPALGALLRGDSTLALSMLAAFGFSVVPEAPVRQIEVELEPHLIASHAYELAGDRANAASEVRREVAIRRRYGPRFRLAQALRRQASFLPARRGLGLLEEAAALVESSPRRPVRVRVQASYGAALRRAGNRELARDVLYRAVDGATEIGMEKVKEKALRELALAGGRLRRARSTGPASLTEAQHQVARLASAGLTNREIAERLFVTIKTVETHLVAVYRKLGIGGRDQLASALGTEPGPSRDEVLRASLS